MKKALLIPFFAMIVSCNCTKNTVAQADQKKKPLYEVLTESQYQGQETQSIQMIKDQGALESLYASINNEKVPEVDFTRQQIVAIFIGTKNTGGYGIKIKEVEEKDGKIYVSVETIKPEKGANVTMAITNPFMIIRINSANPIILQ